MIKFTDLTFNIFINLKSHKTFACLDVLENGQEMRRHLLTPRYQLKSAVELLRQEKLNAKPIIGF